jgi:hypothetical protein
MNEQDLRDCFAMFALNGILSCPLDIGGEPTALAYKMADAMLEARKHKEEEQGIVAIRKRKVSK